ncbi:hypothetical protein B0H11DRAFT_1910728 [Mycena galericulata]|nr:hypothetical protein B0H11DRAFT_1910728 [Mycena galericulata]
MPPEPTLVQQSDEHSHRGAGEGDGNPVAPAATEQPEYRHFSPGDGQPTQPIDVEAFDASVPIDVDAFDEDPAQPVVTSAVQHDGDQQEDNPVGNLQTQYDSEHQPGVEDALSSDLQDEYIQGIESSRR